MPHWVLSCPNCDAELVYSEIPKDITLSDLCFPRKPDFPQKGLQLECSNCKKASCYQREQLTYRKT